MGKERYLENSIINKGNIKIYKGKKLIYSGPVQCVKVCLGNWGRGNLFSNWFDDKTNGMEYDNEYYLPDDWIEELYDICKKIISNPKKAKEFLPSYNDKDFNEVVSTKNILEKTLKSRNTDFRYIIASI